MKYQALHFRDDPEVTVRVGGDASLFSCAPPLNLADEPKSEAFTASLVPHEYSLEHGAGSPFVAEFKDAIVVTEQYLILRDDYFYLDAYHNAKLMKTVVPISPIAGPLEDGHVEVVLPPTMQPKWKGPVILLASPHAGNYHHWMLETLPRLWAIEKFPEFRGLPIVLPPLLRRFQQETLGRLIGPGHPILIQDSGTSTFEHLIVPSYLAPGGHSREQLDWLRSKLLPISAAKYGRRLYIARDDSQNGRKLIGEEDLLACLNRYGFERVVLSDMSHFEQVCLFAGAEIILGVSGAGIVNHIFASEGSHVIELHPEGYTNRTHFFTSSLLGQSYQFVICDDDDTGNLIAPIDRVINCVERVL